MLVSIVKSLAAVITNLTNTVTKGHQFLLPQKLMFIFMQKMMLVYTYAIWKKKEKQKKKRLDSNYKTQNVWGKY